MAILCLSQPAATADDSAAEFAQLRARINALEASLSARTSIRTAELSGDSASIIPVGIDQKSGKDGMGSNCCSNVGYTNGFFLTSCDDKYRLKIRGLLQMRYMATWRDTVPPAASGLEPFEGGFEATRGNLSWYAAYVGRENNDLGRQQWGFMTTAAMPLDRCDRWQMFGRYEFIDYNGFTDIVVANAAPGAPLWPSGTPAGTVSPDRLGIVSLGITHFFNRHAAKLTVEG